MATAMESPVAFPESPMEADDAAYPCKGCGKILEEGKAFELAGNRWHIDCFACNTCGTLLDSDANLLLLGDGSLICNNCTYSCSNCGNKIEDLAILTGDQAFCANCFKCRNCKRKIENLRYARTSQGIFCMDCHEALMARRRKRTTKNSSQRSKLSNNVQLDKSLPAIPPPEARKTAYIPESHSSPFPEVYTEPSEAGIPSVGKMVSELQGDSDSRPSTSDQNHSRDMLTLPSTTFRNNRHSVMSQRSDLSGGAGGGGGEEFLIPLAFDPTPQPATESPSISNQTTQRSIEEKSTDYFTSKSNAASAQSHVTKSNTSSPHIAYQEKGRLPSREAVDQTRRGNLSISGSANASPYIPVEQSKRSEGSPRLSQIVHTNEVQHNDRFKLQEAPKSKKFSTSTGSRSEGSTPKADISTDPIDQLATKPLTAPDIGSPSDGDFSTPMLSNDSSPAFSGSHGSPKPAQLPATSILQNLPKRGDSLDSAKRTQNIPRKELGAAANIGTPSGGSMNSGSSTPKPVADLAKANGGKIISGPIGSPNSKGIFDAAVDDSLIHDLHNTGKTGNESFVDPRAPPLPPFDHSRSRNESFSTLQSENQRSGDGYRSPGLPRYSAGGEFTMDEDMARIMAGEEPSAHESFLRRVSNSVRHGRSYSDKTGRLSKDRWPRSPAMPISSIGQEISSPSTASPENRDELAWFKNELRRERQRTIEREKRIAELEMQLDSAANIKQVNVELKEKRSTIVVLDTQKEIVIRELEVLTEHLAAAKHSGERFDLGKLSNVVLRDFAEALEKLKDSFAPQIEASIQKRNDLVDEIANLTQMKDKSFMEFEQLSSKNAQLAELNNQLVHQIQGLYKANSGKDTDQPKSAMNGLGIYSHHKEKSNVSFDSREMRNMSADLTNIDSTSTLQGEAEPVTVLQGPQMVNIRKGQPKKFDWRKGQKVAKGVTKGLKGAFSSTQQNYSRDLQFAETGAYGSTTGPPQEYSSLPRTNPEPVKQSGFGFFSTQKVTPKSNGLYATQANASTPSLLAEAGARKEFVLYSVVLRLTLKAELFGSELEHRAEYEKTSVPAIVKRCVEEVESRGMDVEGIYRKSGGNSQVQQVKDWFENPSKDFDLSDPDLDIHAVTSGLKQYFRRLPTPLITFDVYDKLLDTTTIESKELRLDAMQRALEDLPKVHLETLEYLIRHLARVVEQEKENLMTSMNIAVVFAPTIMRPESLNRELSDTKMKNEAVMWMVENSERLFGK
ncbi:RhoGAP domain containing protein [Fonsecaea pedrosoi]|nr:RhoGAP domain containing protein [Fonsecaea pedrosoi]